MSALSLHFSSSSTKAKENKNKMSTCSKDYFISILHGNNNALKQRIV